MDVGIWAGSSGIEGPKGPEISCFADGTMASRTGLDADDLVGSCASGRTIGSIDGSMGSTTEVDACTCMGSAGADGASGPETGRLAVGTMGSRAGLLV
jgi:hypothetical protein